MVLDGRWWTVGSAEVSEGCYVSMLKNEFGAELMAVCPGQNFARGGEPCAAACEMTRETLKKLRAMAESCNEEGRGDDVARGIHTLSEFAASETCSGGAASLVATKGATTSWFAQPDQAELMQGAVKESFAVGISVAIHSASGVCRTHRADVCYILSLVVAIKFEVLSRCANLISQTA